MGGGGVGWGEGDEIFIDFFDGGVDRQLQRCLSVELSPYYAPESEYNLI